MKASSLTLPNLLTLSRILVVVPIYYLINNDFYLTALLMSLVAFMTDFFDGKLARKLNCTSELGAILDPIADKFISITLMLLFVYRGDLNPLYFLISLFREGAQLVAIPILLYWKKISFKVKPKLIPKIGTALKFVIIGLLFLSLLIPNEIPSFSLLLGVSAFIEIYILVTFLPRFYLIYSLQHDTFE